mmetsp:Transcript_14034/g.46082  ORF Transcript_14034/g.46082 Transcript_14034/m.46082 type:complete len:360 (-) Transcript_14034:18-1097(-)
MSVVHGPETSEFRFLSAQVFLHRIHPIVAGLPGGAPRSMSVELSREVAALAFGEVFPNSEVSIVRERDAAWIWLRALRLVAALVPSAPAGPIRPIRAPQYKIDALARGDVVRAVPLAPQMNHSSAGLVHVRVLKVAMVSRSHSAAKCESARLKLSPEANDQRHFGVIGMHVQARIFVGAILNQKRVVSREHFRLLVSHFAKEHLRQRPHVFLLHLIQHWLEPDLVENQTVVVHRVGSSYRETARLVRVRLVEEQLRKRGLEQREGVHVRCLLPHESAQRCRVAAAARESLSGASKGGVETRLPSLERVKGRSSSVRPPRLDSSNCTPGVLGSNKLPRRSLLRGRSHSREQQRSQPSPRR